jgi:hypothetical protein
MGCRIETLASRHTPRAGYRPIRRYSEMKMKRITRLMVSRLFRATLMLTLDHRHRRCHHVVPTLFGTSW